MLATAGTHLAVVLAVLSNRPTLPVQAPSSGQPAIQWLLPVPQVTRRAPSPPVASAVRPAEPKARAPARPAAAIAIVDPALAPLAAHELAPVAPSAAEIMRIAKLDIGKITREMSKELAAQDEAPLSTVQARLEQRFAEAHAAARPNWYQAAKVVELTPPGFTGARVYRISTALGAFCMIYPKNGGPPSAGNCPE